MNTKKIKVILFKASAIIIVIFMVVICSFYAESWFFKKPRLNSSANYLPTKNIIVISCNNGKSSGNTQDLSEEKTIFYYWFFEQNKQGVFSKKLIFSNVMSFKRNENQSKQFHPEWICLIKSSDKYVFFNDTSKGWYYFEIQYDSKNNQIAIENKRIIKGYFGEDYPVAIDLEKRRILDSSGIFTNIEYNAVKNMSGNSNSDTSLICHLLKEKQEVRSVILTDDNLFVAQAADFNNSNGSSILLLKDLKNNREQMVKFGLDPHQEHDICFFSPTDINDSRDKVAFLLKHPGSKQPEQWLCIWDLNTNKAKAVTKLADPLLMTPNSLLWRPGKGSHEIAVCAYNRVILVDISTGYVFQKISPTFRLIRWSPDGTKLGMMDYKGRLYYYEMKTKKLIKVDENPDYINFFWVE